MVCYADDTALTADRESDLRLLYNFHLHCLKYNMKILVYKSKVMPISKEPVPWKLEIDDRMVEQVMESCV